jgi:hypothetical protein
LRTNLLVFPDQQSWLVPIRRLLAEDVYTSSVSKKLRYSFRKPLHAPCLLGHFRILT